MNQTLYYTVEKETYQEGSENGNRTITVYKISNNIPRIICEIFALSDDLNEPFRTDSEEIQEWLDDYGSEDNDYEIKKL